MNEFKLASRIVELRKSAGLTQEQLAARLGVSYQAVSKWENDQSCPDIQLLPDIADIFHVSIDSLFGRESALTPETEPLAATPDALVPVPEDGALPWPDDGNFYFVLYHGHELILEEPDFPDDPRRRVEFCWEGPLADVHSVCGVNCDAVSGSVSAGGDVNCDGVAGNVEADGDVDCGDVRGSVNAGRDVDCGDVLGHVSAGCDVDCGDVAGSVSAGGDVDCGDVLGRVAAGGGVDRGKADGGARSREWSREAGDGPELSELGARIGETVRESVGEMLSRIFKDN